MRERTDRPSIALLFIAILSGCATTPTTTPITLTPPQAVPQLAGSYYEVQRGETLWGVAHDFGIDVNTLASANRLPDPTRVEPGQRLFIPTPPTASQRFLWPARGRSHAAAHAGQGGVLIQAAQGSFVRASRSGRVAVAANDLAGFGKTIILDHQDGYVTVYAGLEQLLAQVGADVRQGIPIGRLGKRPLYFEIRQGIKAQDPLRLLP